MTKDELLKLIEEHGEFWYISKHWSTGYPHGDVLLWFRKDDASNIFKYQELVDHCIKDPRCVQIDYDNRLFLLNQIYDIDLPTVNVLHHSKKNDNVLVNFDEKYFE